MNKSPNSTPTLSELMGIRALNYYFRFRNFFLFPFFYQELNFDLVHNRPSMRHQHSFLLVGSILVTANICQVLIREFLVFS